MTKRQTITRIVEECELFDFEASGTEKMVETMLDEKLMYYSSKADYYKDANKDVEAVLDLFSVFSRGDKWDFVIELYTRGWIKYNHPVSLSELNDYAM